MAVLEYSCGTHYVGAVGDDGLPCGVGQLCMPSGVVCTGEFLDGALHGDAVQRMPSGDVFVGQFRRGRRYGTGTFTFANGKRVHGQWADGVYMRTSAQYSSQSGYLFNPCMRAAPAASPSSTCESGST